MPDPRWCLLRMLAARPSALKMGWVGELEDMDDHTRRTAEHTLSPRERVGPGARTSTRSESVSQPSARKGRGEGFLRIRSRALWSLAARRSNRWLQGPHESIDPSPRRSADCLPVIQRMARSAPRRPSPGGRGCPLGAFSQLQDQPTSSPRSSFDDRRPRAVERRRRLYRPLSHPFTFVRQSGRRTLILPAALLLITPLLTENVNASRPVKPVFGV